MHFRTLIECFDHFIQLDVTVAHHVSELIKQHHIQRFILQHAFAVLPYFLCRCGIAVAVLGFPSKASRHDLKFNAELF
ncbi:Uncharacterised protein [Vibrio cholerae]|nr:Uncharacterised protein [Vibrio cholerae]